MKTDRDLAVKFWLDSLADDIDSRKLAIGAQLSVILDNEVIADWSYGVDGLSRPMSADTINAVSCAGKPLTALGAAVLVDRGAITWDAPLWSLMPIPEGHAAARLTLNDLLTHRAGLFHLRAAMFDFLPLIEHTDVILAAELRGAHRTPVYADYAGWHLLGVAMAQIVGDVSTFLRCELLSPLGVRGSVFPGFTSSEFASIRDDVSVNAALYGPNLDVVPLLLEQSERIATGFRPATGVFASARGLASVYAALLRVLRDQEDGPISLETLRTMVRPATPSTYDPALRRRCSWGRGFMTDLALQRFGSCVSHAGFGHSGGSGGTTFAFADPEHNLAVAIHYIGQLASPTSIDVRREARVEDLYAALGLTS